MNVEIKELEEKIAAIAEASPAKVDLINRLAFLQFEINPLTTFETSQQAIALAQEINYKAGEAQGMLYAGMSASAQRKYDEALRLYENVKKIRLELEDEEGIAVVHAKLGNTKLYSGNYSEALQHYKAAIVIREQMNDVAGAADLYANSGIIYGLQGSHLQALQTHLHALKIYEQAKDDSRIASSLNNIGLIYLDQKNFAEALKMFERALEIRKEKNDTKSVSDLLNNIGTVYHAENKLHEALEFYQQAQRLREKLGDKAKLGSSYSNMGKVYKDLGQHSIAIGYYETAFELFKESNEKRGVLQSYFNLGEIFLEKKDFEKAKEFLDFAVKSATETGLKNYLRDALQSLSTLFATQQDFKKAYENYVQYTLVDKEISNADTSKQIAQMNVRHEIEQREREAEIERAKNIELKKAFDSLEEEKKRSENLLHNILPEAVADEIKRNGKSEARYYELASVMFCDIVGFTTISETLGPQQLINAVDECYSEFDAIVEKHGIEKIKIIGDSYMCAGGLPIENETHALDIINAAFEMREFTLRFSAAQKRKGLPEFHFRFGINSGALVTGIVGAKKFAYDIWGDTVNVASRMEQNSEPDKINISGSTYEIVKDRINSVHRGKIKAKNKGEIDMYFVESVL